LLGLAKLLVVILLDLGYLLAAIAALSKTAGDMASQQLANRQKQALSGAAGVLGSGSTIADQFGAGIKATEGVGSALSALADALEAAGDFPPSDFGALAKGVSESLDVGMGKILKPARAALTGTLGGPELAEIVALLGREEAVARLRAGVPE